MPLANGRMLPQPGRTLQAAPQIQNYANTFDPNSHPMGDGWAYTQGPAGTAGGLTRNPVGGAPNPYYGSGVGQMGPAQQPAAPYGYGQAPGQTGLGYYEQQTPVGSFAAAEWGGPVQQQYGQAFSAQNPYIGQAAQGIGGQQSVMPYAQQMAEFAQQANPYLGQQSQRAQQAGVNPYAGANPYLGQAVGNALQQAGDSFRDTVLPQFSAMEQASGSFGNTGVQQARERALGDFGRAQTNAATAAYMQDYTQQQGLGENALNRAQGVNLANAQLSAGDLSRNVGGWLQGQGQGVQGLSSLLGAGQFDASLGNNVNQFNAGLGASDLARNASLAQNLGQFNAGQLTGMSQFNAGQGNSLGMFGAGQRQAVNLYNAGAGNNMLENWRNRDQNMTQFNENLDWNIDQGNWQRQQQGLNNALGIYDRMVGYSGDGLNTGTFMQNVPMNYWQQFAGTGGALGGLGGTNSQVMQGNPWLGALGGWLSGGQLFGGGRP